MPRHSSCPMCGTPTVSRGFELVQERKLKTERIKNTLLLITGFALSLALFGLVLQSTSKRTAPTADQASACDLVSDASVASVYRPPALGPVWDPLT